MKKHFQTLIVAALFCMLWSSCKKDNTDEAPTSANEGSMTVSVENYINNQLIKMDGTTYINPNGDTYDVTKLRYFISNITLIKDDGTAYKVPESYYLIDESKPASKKFVINNIPVGSYKQMKFILGVDSARNTSGAQTGALDPGNDMFWSWNTGYIFFKLEGNSPQAITNGGNIAIHVGGYKAPYNNIRQITLNIPATIVKGDATTQLFVKTDINEALKTPSFIDFATKANLTSSKDGGMIADNYLDMFAFDKVINP